MKVFSTFAGVEGMGQGLPEEWERVGFSEVDKYASQVLAYHYPTVKNYGDITRIDWKEVPDFDFLTGGSPCQDFSIAGKRRGLAGAKSSLAWEYIRALREKRPAYFLWENVKGVLSSRGGWDFGNLLTAFSESGYSLWWQVLNAKDFGVPQNRERIFVFGTREGTAPEVLFERESGGKPDEQRGDKLREQVANTLRTNYSNGKSNETYVQQLNNPKHSNNRVYGDAGISPALNTMQGGNRQPFIAVPEATKKGYAEAEEGDSINLSIPNSSTRRGRVGKKIAQTLDTGMQQYTLQGTQIRRLTPRECERLMSWPDDWTRYGSEGEISDSQRYKMCGNGVVSAVVRAIIPHLI